MRSYAAAEASAVPQTVKVIEPIAIAVCCFVIIAALVVGVGLAAGLVLRHVVQTLPLWFGVLAGARGYRGTGWIGLPMFVFWLVLMLLIWLYLLGIARVISGHFSPVEIAMTVIIGTASVIGIAMSTRLKSSLSAGAAQGVFILVALVQWAFFRVSFLPAIAHR